jgi:restriction system protein
MARQSRKSSAEDLTELVALLPWWAGIALAAVSYGLLHAIAAQPVPPPRDINSMTSALVGTLVTTLAGVGQYLVPAICLLGAAISAWKREKRKGLVTSVAHDDSATALDKMKWQEFEMLVGEAFRLEGYEVTETGGNGPDGGVDLILKRHGEKFLVQCKQWKAYAVGVRVIRELYGVMAAQGAAGGYVVTSGRFTEEAQAFAQGRNVKLVDGPALHALIGKVGKAKKLETGAVQRVKPEATLSTPTLNEPSITCPKCAKPMVKRTAKRGANTGGSFWGCTEYPVCTGTRTI